MGASFERGEIGDQRARFYDILFDGHAPQSPQSNPQVLTQGNQEPQPAVYRRGDFDVAQSLEDLSLHLIPDQAIVDISGPEFNFVRSIRVFRVRSV